MTIDRSNLTIIDNDLEHSTFAIKSETSANLRKIKILGTGGTIASKGSSSHQTAGYQVDLTIDELISSIPDISSSISIEYEQVMNLDSKEMDSSHLVTLYKAVVQSLEAGVDGIVITHGTDTMEETTIFLQFCIETVIPIVVSGSMRPSTSISADGPMNLYQAICIAAEPKSRGRGVLVSLNDQISSGYYITKANANTLDTFNGKQGYLGNFVNNDIHYYYPPAKPTTLETFKLDLDTELAEVVILYAHQGMNKNLFRIILDNLSSVKGIVIATMGAGSLSESVSQELAGIWQQYHIPIIVSKRTMDGMVPKANIHIDGIISAGYLNPQKARILLQLCLNSKFSHHEIKKAFTYSYGG